MISNPRVKTERIEHVPFWGDGDWVDMIENAIPRPLHGEIRVNPTLLSHLRSLLSLEQLTRIQIVPDENEQ